MSSYHSVILTILFCLAVAQAFQSRTEFGVGVRSKPLWQSQSTEEEAAPPTTAGGGADLNLDPKEAVKLFGRLAEKYIMLDESGGMCCYSGCSDCEYRLPGGGYRMADQSSSRPKWIPSYASRSINGKVHESKWGIEFFGASPSISKERFVSQLQELAYAPPLGGPYVAASAADIEDRAAAEALFDILAEGKDNLTKYRMSARLLRLAKGEQGLTWVNFQKALGV